MPKRVLRSNSGVTLLEITFAMGILVVAISMMFGALIGMQQSSQTVLSRSAANSAMRTACEMIQASNIIQLSTKNWPAIEIDGVKYAITVEAKNEDGVLVEMPLAEAEPDADAEGEAEGEAGGEEDEGVDPGDYPNPIEVKVTLTWAVYPEYDGNNELVGGRIMQMSTRVLVEGEGAVVIPTPSA